MDRSRSKIVRAETPRSLRRACKSLHRWLGLSLGAILVLIGLTGSFNVFHREIDAALNPALFTPSSTERRIGPQDAIRVATAVDPSPVTAITVPDPVWPVWVVTQARPGSPPRLWTTMVDPATGAVLGRRDTTWAFAHATYRLHYTLLLKEWWGKEFVGVVGIGLALAALSGLVAWWPSSGRWLSALLPRRGGSWQRVWIELHRGVGVWAAAPLILIAVTGVGIIYPGLVRPVIGLMSAATPLLSPTVTPASSGAEQLPADAILAKAVAARPGETVTRLNPPSSARNAWRILLRPVEADPAFRARTQLWLDPWTGRIVQDRSWDAMSNGDRYVTLQLWLHNGSIAGLAGRMLVFATGFAPLALFATGFFVWLDRRRRRRHLTNRKPRIS